MRIILVFVSTLDGKITKWGDPKVSSWTSEEDKKYFRKIWNEAPVIDEIWLTIEPRIFGKGGNFVIEQELDLELRLISCEQINPEGTLIVKYKVLKKYGIPD